MSVFSLYDDMRLTLTDDHGRWQIGVALDGFYETGICPNNSREAQFLRKSSHGQGQWSSSILNMQFVF